MARKKKTAEETVTSIAAPTPEAPSTIIIRIEKVQNRKLYPYKACLDHDENIRDWGRTSQDALINLLRSRHGKGDFPSLDIEGWIGDHMIANLSQYNINIMECPA